MQYLYGSGEAAALSEQAYTVLTDHVRMFMASRKAKPGPRQSVVLAPGTTLERMDMLPCGEKPVAAVFDMDETAVLNLGYEYDDARQGKGYDPARWARWEQTGAAKVVAVPGAERAFDELRAMGVTVIVNTNRTAASADATAQALANAGLGRFTHGDTLFLKGDVDGKSGKDGRRAAIAARYCVAAMAGDQLGDFTDLFTGTPAARRAAAASPPTSRAFGEWWFVLPNPVYGTAMAGGWDDLFPADKRWVDAPATGAK
jgi:5'-nucleotidase (lipoprotein e(P4) family)